ncbi:proton-gated ion channel subunit pbo-5-like [Ruditapes philippinarum]|uniref:proton-gated ion channel subunit pbo-5-like n=1 Tax=Ruditapes philippinarum TaxID=129788 RepID=UPI00295B4778|nr:proton-gated ion channel subunit pbo-5-like [Ruditapes philippinarum]
MTPACTFRVRYNIDTTFYLFDTHECSFYFIVSNHDSTELVLNSPIKLLDTRNLEENGEWEVANFAENIDEGKDENIEQLTIPMLRASFTLKRRPLSALINSMAPSLLLCILYILTCWVRSDSGERLSVVVTLYLAFVFSTTSLMDKIPNNSLKMPVLSFFILTVNIINALCVTWSIFVVHLAKADIIKRKLPTILTKMVMKNKRISMSKIRKKVKPVIEIEQAAKVQDITGKDLNDEKEEDRVIDYDNVDGISGLELSSVNLTQYVKSIESLDISSGELLITGYFEIKWTDEMLTWDRALYGGREKMQLPKDKYWKPEISLTDGPANEDTSIYGSGFYPAWATYKGLVMIIAAGSYKTKCIVDTQFYPFDMHSCYFQFIVSNHDSTELVISSPSPDIHLSDFKENGEWEVKSTDTNVMLVKEKNIDSVGIPMYKSSFLLKRRSKFEMINSLTPIMFMLFLNIATCFVRPESGERTTFAITLYLALVFAATALTETIPRNSLKIPVISYQLLTVNLINTVGVLWSIFIVNCASKSAADRYLPNFLLRMIMKRRKKSKNNVKMITVEESVVSILPVEGTDIRNSDTTSQKEEVCNEPRLLT